MPSLMAKWDGSEDPNNWKYAAECAASRILSINPNLLVMIEGVEVYPKDVYDWTAPAIDWSTITGTRKRLKPRSAICVSISCIF